MNTDEYLAIWRMIFSPKASYKVCFQLEYYISCFPSFLKYVLGICIFLSVYMKILTILLVID